MRRVVMWCVVMRRIMVGSAMLFAVRPAVAIVIAMVIMTMLGFIAGPSAVVASAIVMEAMPAPAVSVSPAGPGTNTKEDAVIEVRLSVKALGRAAVGWSFIIAPLADGWFADFDGYLRANCWHKGQARKQCCRAE